MTVVARFYCRVCRVGQGLAEGYTQAQQEAFDRFCKAHKSCWPPTAKGEST